VDIQWSIGNVMVAPRGVVEFPLGSGLYDNSGDGANIIPVTVPNPDEGFCSASLGAFCAGLLSVFPGCFKFLVGDITNIWWG